MNIYESFFINSLEGIIIFDSNGKIVNANTMAAKLFDREREELKNTNINNVIGEKHHAALWEICNALIAGESKKIRTNLRYAMSGERIQ